MYVSKFSLRHYATPDVKTIGTFVLKQCDLPPMKALEPRCTAQADGETYPVAYTAPVLATAQCNALSAGIGGGAAQVQ
jgi:hypothetical protein